MADELEAHLAMLNGGVVEEGPRRRAEVLVRDASPSTQGATFAEGKTINWIFAALTDELQQPRASCASSRWAGSTGCSRAVWPNALRGGLPAVDRVLRITERRARLLGLDSPARAEVWVSRSTST